jgi:hypothetical protein
LVTILVNFKVYIFIYNKRLTDDCLFFSVAFAFLPLARAFFIVAFAFLPVDRAFFIVARV